MIIPFLDFTIMHREIKTQIMQAIEDVYDSNWYIMGGRLDEFEKSYAILHKVKQAVGVSNGLDALFLSLKALDIQEGDEVIIPSNTYIATALAVSYLKAKPVFVEPCSETYNINPTLIKDAITLKTKAIIPVHLYGQACQMEEIIQLADRYSLKIIEDNAQSHLATFKGKITGSWGHANATSFYPGKNLGALGDGGAVTTDDPTVAEKIRVLRNYGSRVKYKNEIIGHNMRLDELQAAVLSVKIKFLNEWTIQRQKLAELYFTELSGVGDIILPKIHQDATHVFHLFVIRTKYRNRLQDFLLEAGIGCLIHYPIPPHLQNAYQFLGYKTGDFPIAEELADTSLSLPIWPGMKKEDIEYVASKIKSFYSKQ